MKSKNLTSTDPQNHWLQSYYYMRAAVSVIWITLAVLLGKENPVIGAVLLVLYPAWDALANYIDAQKSGGLAVNPPQKFNLIVSMIVALAIVWALSISINTTIKVFGLWAIFSGVLQLSASLRRWKTAKEGANKQVISSQADSLIKISRIWADFFPANTSNQPI